LYIKFSAVILGPEMLTMYVSLSGGYVTYESHTESEVRILI